MNARTILLLALVLFILTFAVSCPSSRNTSTDQSANSAKNGDVQDKIDGLEGVLFPEAVIRFKVGGSEISEGLHFVESKREKGHFSQDMFGRVYELTWQYLGSDEQSDNYEFSIVLPTEPETPIIRAISYTGADHMIIHQENENEVAIAISESMESERR